MTYKHILGYAVMGNAVQQWLICAAALLSALLALHVFKMSVMAFLRKLAEKTETTLDDLLLEVFDSRVYPYFYFLAVYFSAKSLTLTLRMHHALDMAAKVALSLMIVVAVSDIVSHIFKEYVFKGRGEGERKQFSGIILLVKAAVWCFGGILILDNLGVKISALVAGMGISGVAVALAAQTVLKDLFSYFAILFDRPFAVGDFVIVGAEMGTIEHIGIKTTRLRSLSGEEIICSNSDLVENRLHNYKRMSRRRVVLRFGIPYESPSAAMKQLPEAIKRIVGGVSGATFDRAHFAEFGDFSLIHEVVYYVEDPDYAVFMDRQQEINLKVREELERLGLRLAYPTRTLHVPPGGLSAQDTAARSLRP
ncbi:MAG: mechanosensitive ion channel family protein [Elusimicrobiales bacterium]